MLFKEPKLVYVSDDTPGYTRLKKGKKFVYCENCGDIITDPVILNRLNEIVIPPMWEDVWICPRADGHLLVTGRDGKRRKQYIYHPLYVEWQQTQKFLKMQDFAEKLPLLRQVTDAHLKNKKWDKNKVMALIVSVLDETGIRIGNQYYADRNSTYGLTTLRRKHLDVEKKALTFEYKAKSNKYRKVRVDNKQLVRLINKCAALPGYELFRYKEGGKYHVVDSSDVNAYIKSIAGEAFSAKDFRTWHGTALAVELYPQARATVAENSRKKLEPTLVKMVSKKLGNTVSVCRQYYIHPFVADAVKQKNIPALSSVKKQEREIFSNYLEDAEIIAYRLIRQ